MNFNRPAASVFAHFAKHGSPKNFPRPTTITQLRQPTQHQTDDDETNTSTPKYRHNTTQRRSYASATQTNSHTATTTATPHSLSLPSTLPSLRPHNPTRTPPSSTISIRHNNASNTSSSIANPLPTLARIVDPSEIPIHVKPPRHPSLRQKPKLVRYDQFDFSATSLDDINEQIKHAVESKNFREAEHLFKVIRERGIAPDFNTLSRMLDARAETSRGTETETREIMELYDEMITRYKPDDASHAAVIRGLFTRSHQIADLLQKSHDEKNLVVAGFRELAPQGFVRLESEIVLLEIEMTKICNLMWEHFQQLSKKSAGDYLRIGAAVSFRTDVDRMDELRRSMPKDAMTARMYFYLINTYGSANKFEKAKEFFEAAMSIPHWGQSDRADIYRVFAKICLMNGEFAEAMKLIDSVATERISPDGAIQSSIMLGCFETADRSTAVETMDRAEQMWPESLTNMGRVDQFTNFACGALKFAITRNNIEFADNILGRLSTRNPPPVEMAQELAAPLKKYIDLCLARSRKTEALQAVRFLVQCKITPEPKAVSSLLLSEGKFDQTHSAAVVDEILAGITANLADPKRYATEWVPFAADYRSLVKQLADGMIGTRRFALSAARLGSREADQSWKEFIAKLKQAATKMHPVVTQGEHPTALELAARNDDKDEICTIVNAMRSSDLVPPAIDTPTYERVFKAITAKGDLLSLGWWRSNASRLASYEPCLKSNPSLLVNRIPYWEKSVPGDEANAIIRRAALNGDLDTVVKQMPKAMPALTFSTVQVVFRTYGMRKDFVGAQAIAAIIDDAAAKATQEQQREFLSRMSGSGMAISCIFGGEYSTAKDILEYMVTKAGLKPEADVYAYYIGQQKWADPNRSAYQIFQEVLSLGIKPTTFFLNTLLHKFGTGRRMDHAFEVFDQFKKNKLLPDDITYGSAINAAVRVANEEVAVQLFSEYLQIAHRKVIKATCVPFNIMMQYYLGTHKNREAVLYYWNLLHREGHKPSHVAYLSLLQAYTCLLPVDMNRAETLMKEIAEPTGSHYAALIFGYGYRLRDFKAANSVMDRMLERLGNRKESVMEPEQAWEALVASFVAHRNIQGAKQARARMVESMPQLPTLYIDNAVIRGCALFDEDEETHVKIARGLYDAMAPASPTSKDLRTPDTYAAMIAVYLKFGQKDRAQEVLTDMRARKFPFRVNKEAEGLVAEPVAEKVDHWVMTNLLRLPALQ